MAYRWLTEYLMSFPGVEMQIKEGWQWERYLVAGRMFAAICHDEEGDPLVTLKGRPQDVQLLRQAHEDVRPGHWMNKENWNSVRLLGELPDETLRQMVESAYGVVYEALPPEKKREVTQTVRGREQAQRQEHR